MLNNHLTLINITSNDSIDNIHNMNYINSKNMYNVPKKYYIKKYSLYMNITITDV